MPTFRHRLIEKVNFDLGHPVISIFYTLVVDLMVYDATFDGMKLAGIIIICCGFLVVLFPENWPDLLQSLIR